MSFWRGSTRALRIAFVGLCIAFGSLPLHFAGLYLSSTLLRYIAVGVTMCGIGVGAWGTVRGFLSKDQDILQ
jgi:hypothetical protein